MCLRSKRGEARSFGAFPSCVRPSRGLFRQGTTFTAAIEIKIKSVSVNTAMMHLSQSFWWSFEAIRPPFWLLKRLQTPIHPGGEPWKTCQNMLFSATLAGKVEPPDAKWESGWPDHPTMMRSTESSPASKPEQAKQDLVQAVSPLSTSCQAIVYTVVAIQLYTYDSMYVYRLMLDHLSI